MQNQQPFSYLSSMLKKPESYLVRGLCVKCEKNLQMKKGKTRKGEPIYTTICSACLNRKRGYKKQALGKRYGYTQHKKGYCEACGFIPVHRCQLDVDHIDNDHSNDDPDNLQTLCANCHRLKTLEARQTRARAKQG